MAAGPELIDVRPDEQLDTARLEPFLRARLEGAEGPLAVSQFGGGHANLTYLLRFGEREFVLRRPPLGPVAPSAHDMRREHTLERREKLVSSVFLGQNRFRAVFFAGAAMQTRTSAPLERNRGKERDQARGEGDVARAQVHQRRGQQHRGEEHQER